ncbi:MAG: LacI family DNA-binding transcriptional regulator [Planctomycetota bacterium]
MILTQDGPLHARIRSHLTNEVVAMGAGQKLPSERALSHRFCVDRVTIRRAMVDLAQQGLIVRQQGRGTFVAENDASRRGKKTAQRIIALVLPDVNVGKHAQLLAGIEEEARQKKYEVLVCNTFNDRKRETETLLQLSRLDLEAIMVHPFSSDSYDPEYGTLLNRIVESGKRVVMVGQYHPAARAASVMSDKTALGFIATNHLICQGHRRICYMCTAGYETIGDDCLSGYKKALAAYGIAYDSSLVYSLLPDVMEKTSYEEVVRLLQEKPQAFTAIATPQVGITHGIIAALDNLHKRVPEDIAVVGADIGDEPDLSYVTYMKQGIAEIGREAVRLLFKDKDGPRHIQILIQPEIVIRRSCGARLSSSAAGGRG